MSELQRYESVRLLKRTALSPRRCEIRGRRCPSPFTDHLLSCFGEGLCIDAGLDTLTSQPFFFPRVLSVSPVSVRRRPCVNCASPAAALELAWSPPLKTRPLGVRRRIFRDEAASAVCCMFLQLPTPFTRYCPSYRPRNSYLSFFVHSLLSLCVVVFIILAFFKRAPVSILRRMQKTWQAPEESIFRPTAFVIRSTEYIRYRRRSDTFT